LIPAMLTRAKNNGHTNSQVVMRRLMARGAAGPFQVFRRYRNRRAGEASDATATRAFSGQAQTALRRAGRRNPKPRDSPRRLPVLGDASIPRGP
jgi:hypothetical protein